ncbi:MAG: DMT family transporter [Paracoccus sp. (in: a-proteobacteria)]
MPSTPRKVDVRKGLLAAAIGGFFFTFDLPLLRLAESDPWTLVMGRGVFLFIAISLGWLIVRLKNRACEPFIDGIAGLGAMVTNMGAPIFYIFAMTNTAAANVVFIMALVPLIGAILSRMVIGESVHPYTWAATAIAAIGVLIIVGGGIHFGTWFGDLCALASAFCTAASLVVIRASGKQLVTGLATGSLASAILAIVVFGASPQGLTHIAGFNMPAWFWIGFDGLVFIPLALLLMTEGPKHIPSADVSMFFLLETILTPVWIWMISDEVPHGLALVGGCIIIVTLLTYFRWRLRSTLKLSPALQES